MLQTTGQAIDFELFIGTFACLFPGAVVTGARDRPQGGLSLMSRQPGKHLPGGGSSPVQVVVDRFDIGRQTVLHGRFLPKVDR
jgi:hypothetical protein